LTLPLVSLSVTIGSESLISTPAAVAEGEHSNGDVFNGEIFNFSELRYHLEAKG
jgi:asparagine synthetase B (glutamine-hydrolysing)